MLLGMNIEWGTEGDMNGTRRRASRSVVRKQRCDVRGDGEEYFCWSTREVRVMCRGASPPIAYGGE